MSGWIWMPHPAHFIDAYNCKFRMSTKVGEVIVSTVGEYDSTGKARFKFEDIGLRRKYETMVFPAIPNLEHRCCPWQAVISGGCELDSQGYNDPGDAYEGHMALCREWENKPIPQHYQDEQGK